MTRLMPKPDHLKQKDFDSLLEWLDSNRSKAAERYEEIRRGLIAVFNYKGCTISEDLADETIDRVARKADELRLSYIGDQTRYFYGVGKRVYLEYLKRPVTVELSPLMPFEEPMNVEKEYECLDRCIKQLNDRNRLLVLKYYAEDKQAKIDSRRVLLNMFALKPSALRVRIFRIRAILEKCVLKCVELERLNA